MGVVIAPGRPNTPPVDHAGGLIVIRAVFAAMVTHTMRFHVCSFNAGDLTYAPTGPQGTTTEADVTATAVALLPLLQPYYSAAWQLRWTALWQIIGGVATRHHVPANIFHAGTNGTALSGIAGVSREILTFSTIGNHKDRVVIEGASGVSPTVDDFVTASTGGAAIDQALVGYLTGVNTAVRARDGTQMVIPAHLTTVLDMRLRRKGLRTA